MSVEARVTMFDVGHGDHFLLEVLRDEVPFRAIVDCNWPRAGPPPALEELQRRGVETLDLLVLSHPHKDHFMGLARIAEYFTEGRRRLVRYADFGLDLRQVANVQYGATAAGRELHDLWARTVGAPRQSAARPLYTPLDRLLPPASIATDVTLASLAPSVEVWRDMFRQLSENRRIESNRLSSVLLFRIAAAGVLMAGDLEATDWTGALVSARSAKIDLRADLVKVGHHGAMNGNPPELWDAIAHVPPRRTHAAISARGSLKHPDRSTLDLLLDRGVSIACTSYGPVCAPYVVASHRAEALRSLGARPLQVPESLVPRNLQATRLERTTCFGRTTFKLDGDGVREVAPNLTGARCHLRVARDQE